MLPVLYLMVSVLTGTQPEWAWRVFPESGFKILTPVDLELKVTEVPTETKVIRYHQYHGGSVSGNPTALSFVVDFYQIPDLTDTPDDAWYRDFFENTIDVLLTSLDGNLVYIDIGYEAGRAVCNWKATYQEGQGIIRGQIMVSDDLYYGLQVFGLKQNKPEAMMQKFIASFRHLEPPRPEK